MDTPGAEVQNIALDCLMHNFLVLSLVPMKFNTLNFMPLKNGKEAYGWVSSTKKDLEPIVLPSSPIPWPWVAHSCCWQRKLQTNRIFFFFFDAPLGIWRFPD